MNEIRRFGFLVTDSVSQSGYSTDEISTVDSRASKIFHNSTMLQRRSPHSRLLLITLIKVTDRSLPNVNSKKNSYGWLDTSIILLRTF